MNTRAQQLLIGSWRLGGAGGRYELKLEPDLKFTDEKKSKGQNLNPGLECPYA